MFFYEVAPLQIVRKDTGTFTYSSTEELEIGQLVTIGVGKKSLVGVAVCKTMQPTTYDAKPISSLIEDSLVPEQLIALAQWMSEYYHSHLATVLQTMLPRGIHKSRRKRQRETVDKIRKRTHYLFNKDQQTAVEKISSMPSGTALLHGVTGSGKTAVYLELTKQTIGRGRSVIILVPEIALTAQLVDEFLGSFENIIIAHSRQTEAERHAAWQECLHSKTPVVVIGPRSALFMPLRSVGLIVIDEAHEPSYKQEQSPRYSALRVASVLSHQHKARLVIGSATPLISDYYIAERSNTPIIRLPKPAKKAISADITLVDMTKRPNFNKHRFFSDILLTKIESTLNDAHQVLLFHNRRGSASTTLCENCGWTSLCPRCIVPYTLHMDLHRLECHICGQTQRIPTSCPDCGAADIIHKGIGTKLIESEIQKLFPKANVARFDGDNASKDTIEKRYKELYGGSIDIIIGTQVVAKGFDLPNLRTVGIVQADAGLSLPDFGASERTFQLIAQAIGRVGRSEHPSSVVVQSYQPAHPSVAMGLRQDYHAFYEYALEERRRSQFPPFTHLLKLTCIYKTEIAAISNSKKFAAFLKTKYSSKISVLGPTPSFHEREGSTFRWQLVVKSHKRSNLVALLEDIPPAHWQYELDPLSLL